MKILIVMWKVPAWPSECLLQPPAALSWPVTLPWPPSEQGCMLWSSNADSLVWPETAICKPIVLVMDSRLRDGLAWKWVHSHGDVHRFLLDNLFRSQLFLSASQWLSPREPDSDRPPLTHESEGFVKLNTRHREWLTQSRWWITESNHFKVQSQKLRYFTFHIQSVSKNLANATEHFHWSHIMAQPRAAQKLLAIGYLQQVLRVAQQADLRASQIHYGEHNWKSKPRRPACRVPVSFKSNGESCVHDEDVVRVLLHSFRVMLSEWRHIQHANAHLTPSPRCADHWEEKVINNNSGSFWSTNQHLFWWEIIISETVPTVSPQVCFADM